MSGTNTKLSYKQLHIIKHALIAYKQRENVSDNDKTSEDSLINKINEQIELMKNNYKIGENNAGKS